MRWLRINTGSGDEEAHRRPEPTRERRRERERESPQTVGGGFRTLTATCQSTYGQVITGLCRGHRDITPIMQNPVKNEKMKGN